MGTILHPSPIFGPIISRRLGISLGINLMPNDGKMCTFDCIYCECGLNRERVSRLPRPSHQDVITALSNHLSTMHERNMSLDALTFAGNGEPTCHPEFANIVHDTLLLRNKYFPNAQVSVLSNATMIYHNSIHKALLTVDNNIQKLDTVDINFINKVNRPSCRYNILNVIEDLKAFNGHVIIQTMFLCGTAFDGSNIDNTQEKYIKPWLDTLNYIKPKSVMIYTIDRETPCIGLRKAPKNILDRIQLRVKSLNIPCSVSY